jgi:signal transduction histidine kinase
MLASLERAEHLASLQATEEAQDLEYIQENYPVAVEQTIQGLSHITAIVGAMNEFARPVPGGWESANINRVLENVMLVARNAYRDVADVEFHFGTMRPVPCCLSEVNQVFLSLIINATQAIGEVVGRSGQRGRITIRTEMEGEMARIEISDTGCGIPEVIRHRVFDPFFTTKEVGKGTGQGLAIAWAVIVNRHQGTVMFQSEVNQGTTFIVRLPCPELT